MQIEQLKAPGAVHADKWKSFRGRYETEIGHNDDLIKVLEDKIGEGTITLLYGTRDEKHNEALVLKQFLERAIE